MTYHVTSVKRVVRMDQSSCATRVQYTVHLELTGWSPGFSRSFPPRGGTPTRLTKVDGTLVAQSGQGVFAPPECPGRASPGGQQVDAGRGQPQGQAGPQADDAQA